MNSSDSDGNENSQIRQPISIEKWRLTDSMVSQLYRRSFPVDIPLAASVSLWRSGNEFPCLGKLLFAFEDCFGPSSPSFDDYKQSFRFPFLMEVQLGNDRIHLLWNLWDIKGRVDFNFRRMIERDEDAAKSTSTIVSLDEVSTAEFEYLVSYLSGWIKGLTRAYCKAIQPAKPFVRSIPSSLTVYGYCENDYFCDHFLDYQEFERRVADLKAKINDPIPIPTIPLDVITETKAWIERAKQESKT